MRTEPAGFGPNGEPILVSTPYALDIPAFMLTADALGVDKALLAEVLPLVTPSLLTAWRKD